MRITYNEPDIQFTIEYLHYHALNFVLERFTRSIPSHSHGSNSYEIHYIPYGYGHVKVEGMTYEIVPNTLYVTGPFIEHEQIPDKEDPMVEYCIYLKTEYKNIESKKKQQSSYIYTFEKTTFWFGQDNQNIHPLMQQIFFELENKYTGYTTQVETLLQQLIILLIRNYEKKQEPQRIIKSMDLSNNKYLIIEECFLYDYKEITLEALSEKLNLSTRQTGRLIKKQYGKTFLQKKNEAKMSAAALLLSHTNDSITEVGIKTGYSSVEHFSNAFKRYFNVSPREYKKRNNN